MIDILNILEYPWFIFIGIHDIFGILCTLTLFSILNIFFILDIFTISHIFVVLDVFAVLDIFASIDISAIFNISAIPLKQISRCALVDLSSSFKVKWGPARVFTCYFKHDLYVCPWNDIRVPGYQSWPTNTLSSECLMHRLNFSLSAGFLTICTLAIWIESRVKSTWC